MDKVQLVKSLLCAALYPQIVVGEAPAPKASGKGGGVKFRMLEEGSTQPVAVAIHPASVNARETRLSSKYLVFAEKVKTTQIYVRDTTPVSPYALILFGGALTSDGKRITARRASKRDRLAGRAKDDDDLVTLSIDKWIQFRVPRRVEGLLIELRERLDELLRKKIANPELELSRAGQGLLSAVSQLIESAA